MTKVTVSNIAKASLSATEAGELLALAAQAALKGKAAMEDAKAKGAAALAVMTAGFASDEVAARPWTFDVKGKAGDVHHHVRCTGFNEFGGTEGAWRYNAKGAVSKDAQGDYKRGFQLAFFGLSENNPAVWTMASKAVAMARAIREEGMTAAIVNGELKLEGGTSDKASAMREAKSLSALTKVANGEEGTNRDTPQNEKSDGDTDTRAATPSEIIAAAALLARRAADGKEALCNSALSGLRAIAKLVADNPEAFAED